MAGQHCLNQTLFPTLNGERCTGNLGYRYMPGGSASEDLLSRDT
ncbi:hypothetical protein IAQ61_007980, partial [Plenodomus lingam]|uniref:Predicted protein n=1 Tax=Leptosphaeria maculans (strain JN3 / isolate v23.1.3 / race Av1-4-5-6-7-8) TaxID=985895 RepID=E5A0L8_LEPMJ